MKEIEYLERGAMINVSDAEECSIVECHNCATEFEYSENGLYDFEDDL